jgi:hypothetical protein
VKDLTLDVSKKGDGEKQMEALMLTLKNSQYLMGITAD